MSDETPVVTNNETTGEMSVCRLCARTIERALLLKNFRGSPGTPVWRSIDRGFASIRCKKYANGKGFHQPGEIVMQEPTS